MKRVVFDFDGTLLDSRQRHVIVLNDCLRLYGIEKADLSDYLAYKSNGFSTRAFLCENLMLSEELAKVVSGQWISMIEQDNYFEADQLYADTISTLQCLNNYMDLYLLSARSNESALRRQVEQFELKPFFNEVICVSPFNATAEKIRAVQRIKPCAIVGDTEVEYQVAQEMKIFGYLLNRGFRSKEYFDQRGISSNADLSRLNCLIEKLI